MDHHLLTEEQEQERKAGPYPTMQQAITWDS